MSDGEQKQRPNANYKLSKENTPDETVNEEIVYHYNRERRLEKAPQSVRDLYNTPQAPVNRFNLLKPLVRTKHLTMMFISIVIISVFMLAISLLGLVGDSYDLDGNQISIQALRYEGIIIVTVNKTVKKTGLARFSRSDPAYTGAVDIAVQPAMTGADHGWQPTDIFYHRIFFTFEPEENYRFSVPFDVEELALVFKSETKTLSLKLKAE